MGTSNCLDLYFIRHGVTQYNLEKKYLGHTNEPLLHNHEDQFTALKKALAPIKFHYCYTSDLKRCVQTTQHLIKNQPICVDNRLRELNFGDWEGKTYNELKNDDHYRVWLDDMQSITPPNGEKLTQLQARVDVFFEDLLSLHDLENKSMLIVTHGGTIRACLLKFHISKSLWDMPVPHGSGYKLSLKRSKGEWICNSWSVVPIQEKEKQ
ncbi:alpha-ribazole phosphatase [Metabacillus crassostreae]|uniref:histidine phosphatase family protein n=1 Tax=Metabacillus crassostreae TaxID=929098 RepID=UPI00195EF301|nr:histidine phosphatase family protein [Metabacillus crassostreae]MBM7602989.1 alpha-ribazole phosphatase [Metabacillus crassostreae]